MEGLAGELPGSCVMVSVIHQDAEYRREGSLDQGLVRVESDGMNFECGTSREDDGICWLCEGLEPRRQLSAGNRGEGPSVYNSTVEESQGQARL